VAPCILPKALCSVARRFTVSGNENGITYADAYRSADSDPPHASGAQIPA